MSLKRVSLVLAASILPLAAQAPVATATATASALVYSPIAIYKVADLNFGGLIATPAAGTVIVDVKGTRTAQGGAVLGTAQGVAQADFSVEGEPTASFSINLPTYIQISNGSANMMVDTFTSSLGAATTLDNAGKADLNVGATLYMSPNQAAGLYKGTFAVNVSYN